MLILAKSAKDHEFLYNARSAHKVSKRSAQKIMDILNSINYQLKSGETWYIHDIDCYDTAYIYAEDQRFTVYKNKIKDIR